MGLFRRRFESDGHMRVGCEGTVSNTPTVLTKHTFEPAKSGERVSANTPEPTASARAGG